MAHPSLKDFGSPNGGIVSHLLPDHRHNEGHLRHQQDESRDKKRPRPSSPPPDPVADARATIYALVDTVLLGGPLAHSYVWYHRCAENLCRAKHAEQSKLADLVESRITATFEDVAAAIDGELERHDEEPSDIAARVVAAFSRWESRLLTLSKVLFYLDRLYLKLRANRTTIVGQGLEHFRKTYMDDVQLARTSRLLEVFARMLTSEEDAKKLGLLIRTTGSPAVFTRLCENSARVAATDITMAPEEVVPRLLSVITREVRFYDTCGFPKPFLHQLSTKLNWTVLFSRFDDVLKLAFPHLFKENPSHLNVIIDMCRASSDLGLDFSKKIRFHCAAHLREQVLAAVEDLRSTKTAVPVLAGHLDRLTAISKQCRSFDDVNFEFELRTAAIDVFGRQPTNDYVITALSKHCDGYLRTKKHDVVFATFIGQVTRLFSLIKNKSDFVTVYRKDLSRRLLLNRSNLALERTLFQHFHDTMGDSEDMVMLEGMFDDYQKSQREYSGLEVAGISDFNALVLDKRNWPEVPRNDDAIVIPPLFQQRLDEFTSTFKQSGHKHNNKVLDWTCYNLHQVTITAQFEAGSKELVINLLQAVVLLLFEGKDTLTHHEIQKQTNIDDKLLKTILGSFEKFNILTRSDASYSFNDAFTDKASRIRLPLSRERESTSDGALPVSTDIPRDRTPELQAIVVKTMKAQRTMVYLDLLAQTITTAEQRGPVTIHDIKQVVEHLLKAEFLMRQADGQSLVYVP